LLKTLFFLPACFSALSLWTTSLHNRSNRILYLFTVLFLLPSWLIETRYLIIPLVLFILFKKDEDRKTAWTTVFWWAGLSAFAFWGSIQGWFFL